MTLKARIIRAFTDAGAVWPDDDSLALPLRGAAVQCENDHTAAIVCDVVQDTPLMLRNAKLMVFLCTAAGWDEKEADKWVARELRAAKNKARESVKMQGNLRLTLSVDHPPRLIVLKIEEHA